MSVLVSELQTRLAYRLGEDGTPADTNEVARRLSFLNEANRKALGETYWWFLQTTASDTTVSGQEIYTLPTDLRDIITLTVDDDAVDPISIAEIGDNWTPVSTYWDTTNLRYYVLGETELHLVPPPGSEPSAVACDSVTSSGTTATVTTTAAHGLSNHQYITVAGATPSGYNGTFRITSVPTTTTLTYELASSLSSPATGTITITNRNIVYQYWQYPTELTNSSTVLIPDQYADCLVAYAYFRKTGTVEGKRGSAGDAIEEYNQITSDMRKENNRRKFFNKGTIPFISDSQE